MEVPHTEPAGCDARVDLLAAEYLSVRSAGATPILDDYLLRLETDQERETLRAIVDDAMWVEDRFPDLVQPGRTLSGRYELLEHLHSGGMGRVWAARDIKLDREVAVKVLDRPVACSLEADDAYARESRILASLKHPGIVVVHDMGRDEEVRYLVMDLVDGKPLDEVVEELRSLGTGDGVPPALDGGALTAAIALPVPAGRPELIEQGSYFKSVARILAELARTLEAAHARGIVHRDIKPSNVMLLGGGNPILLDFGLGSKVGKRPGPLSQQLFGTPCYLAPEQVRRKQMGIDPRTDVYQLGAVMYELLTLQRAFPGREVDEVLERIVSAELRAPRQVDPNVPHELEDICLRAMASTPARRYQSVRVFRDDLERFLEGRVLPVASRGRSFEAPVDHAIPQRFDVLEQLAQTDVQVLLRGWDKSLEREVLLEIPGEGVRKILSAVGDRSRALREARMLARVQHRGVSQLLDVIETPAGPMLVLEPRAGEALSEVLERQTRMSSDEVRRLGRKLAEAAQAVHAVGVVHRGIDEANVLIEPDGDPVLTGFVFAKPGGGGLGMSSLDYGGRAHRPFQAALPKYPAPEQIAGHGADARSDVFGLGCVLYRCLAGKGAFGEGAVGGWQPPEELRKLRPDVPKDLAATIHKCLARGPMGRFQTMRDLAAALGPERAGAGAGSGAGTSAGRVATVLAVVAALVLVAFIIRMLSVSSERGREVDVPVAGLTRAPYASTYAVSRALLIGIDYVGKQHWTSLSNAESDVDEIAEALRRIGWSEVRTLEGPEATRSAIVKELAALKKNALADDQVLIYYAGHGERHEKSERSGFAIPFDAGPSGDRLEGDNWLHFGEITRVFEECDAKHILVAFDCCHGGAGLNTPRGSADPNRVAAYLTQEAHVVMASARPNDQAWDVSPFAKAFVEVLHEAAGGAKITSTMLHARIQSALMEAESGQQAMHGFDGTPGDGADFLFIDRRE